MKNTIYILLLVLTMASCNKSKEVSKIERQDWLLGKWENKSDEGNLLEIWKKANDSLFLGESYFIKEKDTLHSEKIELKQKGELPSSAKCEFVVTAKYNRNCSAKSPDFVAIPITNKHEEKS